MSYIDPRWLWALALVPVLLLLEWRAVAKAERALGRLVGERESHPLLEQRRPGNRRTGIALRFLALTLLVAGAAGPEWGREQVRRAATGSDVVLAIDVSASMDSRDVPPSRLAEARREALAVLDRLEGSRVGVVAFAGDAVRLCPLTQDLPAVRLTLESLSSGTVSEPGTDLGKGLHAARRLMPRGRREEQAVVLWTDGEDLERGARGAIEEIAASGIRVFAVGVGTRAGDVVPVLDPQGRATDIKRDESGNAVRSRIDEPLLRSISQRTHGAYFAAARPGGELPRLLFTLGGLSRSVHGERLVERPVARFPLCALLAVLLLALELGRPRRGRLRGEAEPALHSERAAAAAALLVWAGLALPAAPAAAQSAWARGDRAFRAGRYAEAESLYGKRAGRDPRPELLVNHATARALQGAREDAERELSRFVDRGGAAGNAARYNLGTVLGQSEEIDRGLATLRDALERTPDDPDARWNYEVLLRRKREQQERKSSSSSPKPKPSPQPQSAQPGGASQSPGGNALPNPQPQIGSSQSGPPPPQGGGGMTRAQAEQLLGALKEVERAELQRQRQMRVTREKRGRDW
ncbi:MAG TPA: VWA domain-containing protein [Candidatus Eisenbacteria bacterium]|jgi:Ca-activated chloride channel family protein